MSELSLPEFADRISHIMPLIMREFARRQMKELCNDRLTLSQFFILEFLYREGDSKMGYLARFMNVSTAAMTGIVERMVKEGYLRRIYDADDRRIIKVKLTERGHIMARKVNQQRRDMIIRIFGKLSCTDRTDYLRVLTQINQVLKGEKA